MALISLAVARSHRRHVHTISATNDPGSSLVACTLSSSSTASMWRVLDPQPPGEASSCRQSSSASSIAASRSSPQSSSHDTGGA